MAETAPWRSLVVIGASAGGIEALPALVSTLPASFPAPIIIAQHLDPSRASHLEEILARRSTLPVRTLQDGQALDPGVVYVVAADRHVEFTDHLVHVQAMAARGRPAPSIDLLLVSAAEAFGEQLVAVILTGLGSDGADGARRVSELGGAVIIQNPRTAAHPEMPLSLAPTTIDIVAELEAIGPLLSGLIAGGQGQVVADDDSRLHAVLEQVRTRSGIDFSNYKEATIRRRIQRRMVDTNTVTLEDYLRYLRRRPEEYDRLTNSFLIKVTDFFRDTDLFAYLRQHVLPGLIEYAREHGNEVRLWSAGCATGEEAYSLAILVSELIGEELDHFTVRIFATDLDGDAVAFARRGVYPSSALKNVPPGTRERYFTALDSAWEVRKQLRGMVIFGQHDLGQRAPFPRIDLVLCRNVLIYFTPELQRRALQLFAFALREGGYLVVGKSESTSPLPELFTLLQPRLKVFQRQGERVLIPPSHIRDAAPGPTPPSVGRPILSGMERKLARAHARQLGTPIAAELAEQVLLELPIGAVVVDARYDIQSINAAARRLLGIHSPALGEDLIHLAHRSLADPLRDAVDVAFNEQRWQRLHELSSLPDQPGQKRHFEISSFLIRGQQEPVQMPDVVAILIADVTERERETDEQQVSLTAAEERATRAQELLDESTRSLRELLTANQNLAIATARLRSANQELLVGNEESQAAMEEIETLNEEQQATNEELETLNEELQATVEELNATNEDLQSRTVELQDQSIAQQALLTRFEEQTDRLETVLSGISDAVMLVDSSGKLVLANRAFREVFGEALPPLEDDVGNALPESANPVLLAVRSDRFVQPFTLRQADGTRKWFEACGQSIQHGDASGGVLVIRDVSERSLRQLQEEFIALASHELRTPLTALSGSLQLLRRNLDVDSDARVSRYTDVAFNQVGLLSELVQDLTDVIRVQAGHLSVAQQRIDLASLVQEVVELTRPIDEQQDIRLQVDDESLFVNGDRHRLEQVLLNLISNAVRYGASPRGVDVRVGSAGTQAVLHVVDYGPGIAPRDRAHLFERFYQSQSRQGGPGLGVGLYLVQAIVTAHHGRIDVHPSDPQGATFVVQLPLAEPPLPARS